MIDELLADLVVGNGSKFARYKHDSRQVSCPSASCEQAEPYSAECDPVRIFNDDASRAIFCTDADSIHEESPDVFTGIWNELSEQSELFSDFWIGIRMSCVGWKVRPNWRFRGEPTPLSSSIISTA